MHHSTRTTCLGGDIWSRGHSIPTPWEPLTLLFARICQIKIQKEWEAAKTELGYSDLKPELHNLRIPQQYRPYSHVQMMRSHPAHARRLKGLVIQVQILWASSKSVERPIENGRAAFIGIMRKREQFFNRIPLKVIQLWSCIH